MYIHFLDQTAGLVALTWNWEAPLSALTENQARTLRQGSKPPKFQSALQVLLGKCIHKTGCNFKIKADKGCE